uniref:Uncharacterized protein n=1 Tax=Euplotes harpa TaxID=151035 RepID=A0A7S3JHX8_9SPIT|mmetsp:Transcript_37452/g.43034  ORF Transcript_37452/g.43034 Transcript_37452/m.43034 type:complete len:253 (+) Transcript_37452:1703-2461(+)
MISSFFFSLLLVGSLFASFSIFVRSFFTDPGCSEFGAAKAFETIYLGILFVFILMCTTKPIEKSNSAYILIILTFGVFVFVSVGFGFKYFWEEQKNSVVGYLLLATVVLSYLVPILLNCRLINYWDYFVGIFILFFLSPLYINIVVIYSMANLHDISWGNRETDQKKSEETKKNLEQFRALYFIIWLFANAFYGYAIIYISKTNQRYFILALTVLVSFTILGKILFAVIHTFCDCYDSCKECCKHRWSSKKN